MTRDQLRAAILDRLDRILTSRLIARLMSPEDRLLLKAARDTYATSDEAVDLLLARYPGR